MLGLHWSAGGMAPQITYEFPEMKLKRRLRGSGLLGTSSAFV